MNGLIILKPGPNKKSPAGGGQARSEADVERILDGWLEETAHAILALQHFQSHLKSWRAGTCQIRPEDVDGVYDILRHAKLGEWAEDGWPQLRAIVTGQT